MEIDKMSRKKIEILIVPFNSFKEIIISLISATQMTTEESHFNLI